MKKVYLMIAVVILAVLITGAYKKMGNFNLKPSPSSGKKISQEAAKQKAVDFVKNNLVQAGSSTSVKEISEEDGLYKIILLIDKQEIPTYMTLDGMKFFPQAMDIAEVEKKTADQKAAEAEAEKNVPKSEKPQVNLYVMSFCPFGNKAEDTMKPVFNLLKDKADFNIHYIVSSDGNKIQSLHGQKEVDQNEREACVLRDYGKDKWMNFVTYVNTNCGSDGSCWEKAAQDSGLDVAKINSCVSSSGLALMQADEKASTDAGATGSPTLVINGSQSKAVYKYGNSEEYKKAICNAFNESPAECSQELSASTSTAEGGSCN